MFPEPNVKLMGALDEKSVDHECPELGLMNVSVCHQKRHFSHKQIHQGRFAQTTDYLSY